MWADLRHSDWPGYLFRLTFNDGELQGIEVRRDGENAAPLSAKRLQQVPLKTLERAVRQQVDVFASAWRELVDSTRGLHEGKVIETIRPGTSPPIADWFDAYDEGARPRNPERDLKLARLARRYVETLGDRKQTQILAKEFHYEPSSITKMVREARRTRGLLSPTTQGTAGGSLTPKALAILANADEPETEE